ncbi:MAG TPA: hypothetical protein VFN54_09885 [Acidimicrobiales bacterium]|nr:hypothetical protein [Acidimicrobiales bacterium]
MALRLDHVAHATHEVHTLWEELLEASRGVRGATAIFDDLGDLVGIIERRSMWLGRDGRPVSLAIVESGIVKILFVTADHRRQGVARSTLAELAKAVAPVDAWALPGDRASKSLYESVGWRARLLTMRGD